MNKKVLTVITITYNQEKYIEKCIESIVMQKTNFDFELVISDDASSDKTRDIIKKYQKKYPNIIKPIFREKNLGSMDNFIETLNSVHTKYVALCDGDDFWTDENKLQKQVDFLEENKDYNICFHQTEVFFEDKSKESFISPIECKETISFEDIAKENVIPANTVVYRWQFTKENSFKKAFPINIIPGDHYVHLMHAYNSKAKFIKEPMSKYRRHSSGIWWATANGSEEEFHLKYGIKFLNFYNEVEKNFIISKKIFESSKKYTCARTLVAFLKNNKYEELNKLHKENKELVEECMKEINLSFDYLEFGRVKKLFYLFFFENKLFREKFKRKFLRK